MGQNKFPQKHCQGYLPLVLLQTSTSVHGAPPGLAAVIYKADFKFGDTDGAEIEPEVGVLFVVGDVPEAVAMGLAPTADAVYGEVGYAEVVDHGHSVVGFAHVLGLVYTRHNLRFSVYGLILRPPVIIQESAMAFHLGLRYNRHQVSLMRQPGRSNEVLAVAYPQQSDRRARILEQWGRDPWSPRHHSPASIDMPLSSRAQAILSYQLAGDIRSRLNGGMEPQIQSRHQLEPGIQQRMHLGSHGSRFDLQPLHASRMQDISATPQTRAINTRHPS